MNKKATACMLAGLLAVSSIGTSCIGPFNATSRIHTWNREIENRWGGEAVFLIFRVAYVYTAAFLGDVLIFNSIQFWGWDNPIDPPSADRLEALREKDMARSSKGKEAARQ